MHKLCAATSSTFGRFFLWAAKRAAERALREMEDHK